MKLNKWLIALVPLLIGVFIANYVAPFVADGFGIERNSEGALLLSASFAFIGGTVTGWMLVSCLISSLDGRS